MNSQELYKETKKLLLYKEEKEGKTIFYRQHKEDEDELRVKTHEIEGNTITCFFESETIKKVIFVDFEEIPDIYTNTGYGFECREINNFFRFKFKGDVSSIKISTELKSELVGHSLVLNLKDYETLVTSINQEKLACTKTKKALISNFISDYFPALAYEFKETNSNKSLIIRNLNQKLIDQLTAEEVEAFGKFYVDATKKYNRPDIVKRMFLDLQRNAQLITLQEIIKQYESLLAKDPPEREWQEFFNEFITLFDTRYVRKLNYKNIVTGLTKYPDLVLVDIYGYIDFYELKKSSTQILEYDKSHKTFYWSKDISMAIAQSSDYLQKSKENALSYAKTIKSETETEDQSGVEVNIINPRAIIVVGTTNELNTAKKKDHFKNLRESLKDIEFVLYDELLQRLQNLLDQVKSKNVKQ